MANFLYYRNGLAHEDSGDPMETTEPLQDNMPVYLPPAPAAPTNVAPVKGKKRKRVAKPPRESIIEPESSEQEDPDWEMDGPPLPLLSPTFIPDPGDGDFHRPSVVTRVPGLKAQVKKAVRKSFNAAADSDISASSGSDFEGKKPKKKGQKGKAAKKAAAENKSSGPEVDSDGRPARKHARTKTGCWICRNRKLNCDEIRPQCTQCARSRPPRNRTYPQENDITSVGEPGELYGYGNIITNDWMYDYDILLRNPDTSAFATRSTLLC